MGFRRSFSPHALFAFFSSRVLRGGPRILAYLAACLVVSLLVLKFVSRGLSDAAAGTTKVIWHWSTGETWSEASGREEDDKRMGYGNDGLGRFRVVVFGEQDVATPSRVGNNKAVSWTDVLCEELHCSTYMSLVPHQKGEEHSLVSIGLYAKGLDEAANLTERNSGPGQDYGFQPEKYPIAWQLADLEQQVTAFLAIKKPKTPLRETLWVFSFGTWDIWSLASLPLNISRPVVQRMTDHIYEQAERLYQSALDPESIAWSGLPTEEGKNSTARRTGMFRILIPKLLDPSLMPGWTSARPELAKVHSKAEQMRNAYILTGEWNAHLTTKLSVWVNGSGPKYVEDAKPSGENGNLAESLKATVGPTEYFEDVIAALQAAAAAGGSQTKRRSAVAEGPLRDGFLFDLPEYLLSAMADGQLRNLGLAEGDGVGASPPGEGYGDVSIPCAGESGHGEARFTSGIWPTKMCEVAQDYLFWTPFTVAPRAIREIGMLAADMVRRNDTMRALWDAVRWEPGKKSST